MPEGNSHGKNLIGTSQFELVVKLLILRVFDRLANDSPEALFQFVIEPEINVYLSSPGQ